MEAFPDEQSGSSYDLDRVEAVDDFLEDSWFYDNLFNRKSKTLSYSFSDPFPSRRSKEDASGSGSATTRRLVRAPSLPPYIGERKQEQEARREEGRREKKMGKLTRQFSDCSSIPEHETDHQPKQDRWAQTTKDHQRVQMKESGGSELRSDSSSGQAPRSSLQRTQTLPADIRRDDTIEDKENYARLSILIREAVASSASENHPRRQQTSKGSSPKPSNIPRPPARSSEPETPNPNSVKGQTRNQSPNPKGLKKTMSNLETQMKQAGFRDSGQGLDEVYSSLQERKQERAPSQAKLRKAPSLSEALISESCESSQDMKAQIKFWARVVASNVRQEC